MKKRWGQKTMLSVALALCAAILMLAACSSGQPPSSTATEKSDQQTPSGPQPSDGMPPLPAYVKERGKLVIGVKVDYPPLGFLDANGKNDGFEIDFAKKLAEFAFGDANAVEFVGVNASNRVPYLNTKKIDFILATMGVTEQRAKEVDFTNQYFRSGVMLLVPKDSDITGTNQLSGKKVIVIKGSTGSKGLESLAPQAEQIKMDSTSEAVRALKDGRGVAFAGDDVLLFDIVKNNPDLKVVGEPFNTTPWAMAARKGDAEMVAWLNACIEKIKQEDLFLEWYNKWFSPGSIPIDPSTFILRP